MPIRFGILKNSPLPSRVNYCPDDWRFADLVNRTLELLLSLGDFWETTREAIFCVSDECFVTPGCVATVEGVRACNRSIRIENQWYTFLPTFNPDRWHETSLHFEYKDQVPTFAALCNPVILRTFATSSSDYSKTIKFLGYDKNKQWIRTRQGGIWQDGEVVTLVSPFADTVNEFTSVTAVIKTESDDSFRVFSYPAGNDSVLTPIGQYEFWETVPSYQRYSIRNFHKINDPHCCQKDLIEAQVKVDFIKVRHDDDLIPIGNRPAMELAVLAMNAMDNGDHQGADSLLFGSPTNKRLGAVPLLNHDIQTRTDGRLTANVRVHGTASFEKIMGGFI